MSGDRCKSECHCHAYICILQVQGNNLRKNLWIDCFRFNWFPVFQVPIDRLQGADPVTLEAKIKQHYSSEDAGDTCEVAGHMDLTTFIAKNECECLNESDQHPFQNTQNTSSAYLESDCDEQLIISINFTQSVKLHSLKIKAPQEQGPKTVKVFINQPRLLDFDLAESSVPVQELM